MALDTQPLVQTGMSSGFVSRPQSSRCTEPMEGLISASLGFEPILLRVLAAWHIDLTDSNVKKASKISVMTECPSTLQK